MISLWYTAMNIRKQLKIAEDMEVSRQFAVTCRHRYLSSMLCAIDTEIYNLYRSDVKGGINAHFVADMIIDRENEQARILKELEQIKRINRKVVGEITDEDIDRAREYPVDRLIDFSHGRSVAFCHESDSPSMSHNRKANRAHCFVCNKSFNPIDVLMGRDGFSFIDAVKELI